MKIKSYSTAGISITQSTAWRLPELMPFACVRAHTHTQIIAKKLNVADNLDICCQLITLNNLQ